MPNEFYNINKILYNHCTIKPETPEYRPNFLYKSKPNIQSFVSFQLNMTNIWMIDICNTYNSMYTIKLNVNYLNTQWAIGKTETYHNWLNSSVREIVIASFIIRSRRAQRALAALSWWPTPFANHCTGSLPLLGNGVFSCVACRLRSQLPTVWLSELRFSIYL